MNTYRMSYSDGTTRVQTFGQLMQDARNRGLRSTHATVLGDYRKSWTFGNDEYSDILSVTYWEDGRDRHEWYCSSCTSRSVVAYVDGELEPGTVGQCYTCGASSAYDCRYPTPSNAAPVNSWGFDDTICDTCGSKYDLVLRSVSICTPCALVNPDADPGILSLIAAHAPSHIVTTDAATPSNTTGDHMAPQTYQHVVAGAYPVSVDVFCTGRACWWAARLTTGETIETAQGNYQTATAASYGAVEWLESSWSYAAQALAHPLTFVITATDDSTPVNMAQHGLIIGAVESVDLGGAAYGLAHQVYDGPDLAGYAFCHPTAFGYWITYDRRTGRVAAHEFDISRLSGLAQAARALVGPDPAPVQSSGIYVHTTTDDSTPANTALDVAGDAEEHPAGTRVVRGSGDQGGGGTREGTLVRYQNTSDGMRVEVSWDCSPGAGVYKTWVKPETIRALDEKTPTVTTTDDSTPSNNSTHWPTWSQEAQESCSYTTATAYSPYEEDEAYGLPPAEEPLDDPCVCCGDNTATTIVTATSWDIGKGARLCGLCRMVCALSLPEGYPALQTTHIERA